MQVELATKAPNAINHYLSVMIARGLYTNKRNLRNHLESVFGNFDFARKKVLEVGGGNGVLSFFAASMGAEEVICLEPESAGSTSGTTLRFESTKQELGLDNVFLQRVTFQAFEPQGKKFDLILLHNSINHLDENACIHLLKDDKADATYRQIFRRFADLANPGAVVVISDCSRNNLFARLGMKNPFAPSIEWHKHQTPDVWASFLREQGFGKPSIKWSSYNSLGSPGRFLLGNKCFSFLVTSHFNLKMVKG